MGEIFGQSFSFIALTVQALLVSKIIEESINKLMDNAVCRTAPATLGLLKIQLREFGSKISALLLANIQTG